MIVVIYPRRLEFMCSMLKFTHEINGANESRFLSTSIQDKIMSRHSLN